MNILKQDELKYSMKEQAALFIRGIKLYSKTGKPIFLSKTIACLFNAAAPFINIWFSAQILNELAGNKDLKRITSLVVLTIALDLIIAFMKSAINRWVEHNGSHVWEFYRAILGQKLLDMDYIDAENAKVQQEYSEIQQHQMGMGFGLPNIMWTYDGFVTGILQVIISISMAFTLFVTTVPEDSPYLFLDSPVCVILVLVVLSMAIFLSPYVSMLGGRIWAQASNDNNKFNRTFGFYYFQMIEDSSRAKDIRIYNQKKIIDKSKQFSTTDYKKYAKYEAKFSAIGSAISNLSSGMIYLFVALKALAGAFGVGSIVQYVGAIGQFSGGLSSVFSNWAKISNNTVYLDKIFRFLDIPNKKYQGRLAVEKRDDNEYDIEFRNVSFQYPGTDVYALKHLNLKLGIGKKMAVVGMNGSGKTTMIKLLCRLYDPTEGMITLNGVNIQKYNYDEYMGIFSVVFQDFKLLPFTLGQNVAAKVNYDTDKAIYDLKMSGFDEKLNEMPHNLDTYLYKNFEEDGVEISGGEAQKIALARALYKDAPFIVLDEPTAALDPIAEFEIYSRFNDIVKDKTAIYISHRLSSCRFCDDIAVFHEGRLIQRGSHDVLIKEESGKYYELWNAQAQYYAEETAV